MSFIDDGINQRKHNEERAALIAEHSPKIYEDLWNRLNAYIGEAKLKGFNIFTNGSLHDRLVELQIPPTKAETVSHRDSFTLTLVNERIIAKDKAGQRGVKFDFSLDVCPDGVVCLKLNGERVETEEAAVKVLHKFLFPELAPYEKQPNVTVERW